MLKTSRKPDEKSISSSTTRILGLFMSISFIEDTGKVLYRSSLAIRFPACTLKPLCR
jgi:hypothetical protein